MLQPKWPIGTLLICALLMVQFSFVHFSFVRSAGDHTNPTPDAQMSPVKLSFG